MTILGAVVVFGLACGGGAGGSEAPTATATRAATPTPKPTLTIGQVAHRDADRNLARVHLKYEGLDCVWILDGSALEVGAIFEEDFRLPHTNLSITELFGQAFIDECNFLNP